MRSDMAFVMTVFLLNSEWGRIDPFESTEGKFRITTMATKRGFTESKSQSANGPLTFKLTTWYYPTAGHIVSISYLDYPLKPSQTLNAEKGLDDAVSAILKKPTTEKIGHIGKIEFGDDKLPGRIFDIKTSDPPVFMKQLMVIKGNRLYHVVVSGNEDFALGKTGRDVVNSFELVK